MKVYIERTNEEVDVVAAPVLSVLSSLGINPEEVLVVRNGSLVTDDEGLLEGDDVKVLSVISGG